MADNGQYKHPSQWVTGSNPATEEQKNYIFDLALMLHVPYLVTKEMTKAQAAEIINTLQTIRRRARDIDEDDSFCPFREARLALQALGYNVDQTDAN
ncbi:hypothetical protein C8Q79DRAFT_955735 [Trametes meyenii]|nr:hypothetical protein C8Q79DRAFT_955735 [Trametes meyenii]